MELLLADLGGYSSYDIVDCLKGKRVSPSDCILGSKKIDAGRVDAVSSVFTEITCTLCCNRP